MEFDLSIDQNNLDKELLYHPQKFYEISSLAATAEKERDLIEFEFKVLEAQLEDTARKTLGKATEGAVKTWVRTQEAYLQLQRKCIEANHKYKTIQAAVISYSHRKMALENLVRLFLANYFSTPYDSDLENKLIDQQIEKQQNKITETLRRRRSNVKV